MPWQKGSPRSSHVQQLGHVPEFGIVNAGQLLQLTLQFRGARLVLLRQIALQGQQAPSLLQLQRCLGMCRTDVLLNCHCETGKESGQGICEGEKTGNINKKGWQHN